jgi:hypothetical protein
MRNATSLFASTFGAIWALAGIEHGIGEVLQGNIVPGAILFSSWPDSAFFGSLNGEPAMTIIPNLLITGILAILFSLALLVWAILFIERKNSGFVMILLSVALLFVGGGIFPPILCILTGAVATRIHASAPIKIPRLGSFHRFLAKLWPWLFSVCILTWLSLFPGLAFLGFFYGVNNPKLILAILIFALVVSILTVSSGFARDSLVNETS